MTKTDKIEVAVSYSQKKNLGNYETIDFFQSAKAEVPYSQFKKASEELYKKCKEIVEERIKEYEVEEAEKKEEKFLEVGHRFLNREQAEETDRLGEQIIAERSSNKPF